MVLFGVLGKKLFLILQVPILLPSLRSEVHPERRPWQSPHVTCRYNGRQRLISNHSQYRCRSQTLQMWLQQLFNGNRMPSTHLKDCKITFGRKCSNSKLKHHSLSCFAFAKKTGKTYHVIQAFTSNSALKTHQMVHTREKPFQVCSRCYVEMMRFCFPWLLFSYYVV